MNKPIPEFTETEINTIETTLADTGVRLESCERELTSCPGVYWKSGQQPHRCQPQ